MHYDNESPMVDLAMPPSWPESRKHTVVLLKTVGNDRGQDQLHQWQQLYFLTAHFL